MFLKRTAAILLCICFILAVFTGCGEQPGGHKSPGEGEGGPAAPDGQLPAAEAALTSETAEENVLRAAVLYDGSDGSAAWQDLYSRLEQPLLLGFTAEAVDISGEWSLEGYDIVYPHESIAGSAHAEEARSAIVEFVAGGGSAFLDNDLYGFFDAEFLGAEGFSPLEAYPSDAEWPDAGEDLAEMQRIMRAYLELLPQYADVSSLELGVAMDCSTAVPLALSGGRAMAAVNAYGGGYVYFASELLPGDASVAGTELVQRGASAAVSTTDMGAARLIENAFAAFVAKRTLGYALWRVYGVYGSPGMSWQAAIEDTAAVSGTAAQDFAALCRQYGQAPSYSLARSVYTRGLRAESVSTLLSQDGSLLRFASDLYESGYSAGTHAVAGDSYLTLARFPDSGGYAEPSGLSAGAYPCACDLDGDGLIDLLCGSSDGRLWFFRGLGYDGRLLLDAGEALTDAEGLELAVPGASAPTVADVDGDGVPDILCGAAHGEVYLFRGLAEGGFAAGEIFYEAAIEGRALPEYGDLNGDGIADLVIGSDCGELLAVYGAEGGFAGPPVEISFFGVDGDWFAPRICDVNGDGVADLALGTAAGYVALLTGDGQGGFASAGCIELDERNADGNYHAKFGENCAPSFADIDGDGYTDLVCGSLEYGLSYPIDSRYFPLREELLALVGGVTGEGWYMGAHFFAGFGASPERESYELSAQMAAMQGYGVAYGRLGAGLHAGASLSGDPAQTYLSLWDGGVLWCAGLSGEVEELGAGELLSLPFYLTRGGERTILLLDASPALDDPAWAQAACALGLPLLLEAELWDGAALAGRVAGAAELCAQYGYSSMTESQLMYAAAAAANLELDVMGNSSSRFDIELVGAGATNSTALYSGIYQTSCGVRVSLGEALSGLELAVDANVWRRVGNDIYIGLDRPVRIYEAEAGAEETPHLARVNLPAMLSVHEGGASVLFDTGGMIQVETSAPATTESDGWTAEPAPGGGTVFTKYSSTPGSILISYE